METKAGQKRALVEIKGLTKRFKTLVAVNDLTLAVNEGDVFGLIGPNGAGKTTTLKMLATLIKPTFGDAWIDGYSLRSDAAMIRPIIGFMPDFFGLYEGMQVEEYLDFFAAAYRLDAKRRRKVIAEVLELTDLTHKRETLVDSLSRGMQQRLSLARVLIHDPKLLLLDEPASGLDPRARVEIRELLKELGRMGKTIIISSHILHELSELCNKVGIVEKGNLLISGNVKEVMKHVKTGITLRIMCDGKSCELARDFLLSLPHVQEVQLEEELLRVKLDETANDYAHIAEALVREGYKVKHFEREAADLEDAFMFLTKGTVS
jgi:ABC-2 type transport system ATP-binding protein